MKVLLLMLGLALSAAAQSHDALQVRRWKSATVPSWKQRSVQVIAQRIEKNWARYVTVSRRTGVPPEVISGLHNMESSGSFLHHLHEGSPLRARTRDVPKGRPKTGTPPFTWEYSAEDALNYDNMGSKQWTKLGPALTAMEDYNGSGYRRFHPGTPSPYLWAGTTVERPGKYVSDGTWSPTARSSQIGIAAIWKLMASSAFFSIPQP